MNIIQTGSIFSYYIPTDSVYSGESMILQNTVDIELRVILFKKHEFIGTDTEIEFSVFPGVGKGNTADRNRCRHDVGIFNIAAGLLPPFEGS